MSSNYPPGVTGMEPQISGVYPPDVILDSAVESIGKIRKQLDELSADLDDQGVLDKRLDNHIGIAEEAIIQLEGQLKLAYDNATVEVEYDKQDPFDDRQDLYDRGR